MAPRYSLEELWVMASEGDVSYHLNRLWRGHSDLDTVEERGRIRRLGYASEAAKWLVATTPERMQYGTATEEERIAAAVSFAGKAGVELADIANEYGLSHLVPDSLKNDPPTLADPTVE